MENKLPDFVPDEGTVTLKARTYYEIVHYAATLDKERQKLLDLIELSFSEEEGLSFSYPGDRPFARDLAEEVAKRLTRRRDILEHLVPLGQCMYRPYSIWMDTHQWDGAYNLREISEEFDRNWRFVERQIANNKERWAYAEKLKAEEAIIAEQEEE